MAVAVLPKKDLVWASIDEADSVDPEVIEKIRREVAIKATTDGVDPADGFVPIQSLSCFRRQPTTLPMGCPFSVSGAD